MDIKNISNISNIINNSVFQIECDSDEGTTTGTGFFVKLKLLSENESVYGLVTCNHILNLKCLSKNFKFTIKFFDNEKKKFTINLNDSYFMFTSEFTDITFIEFNSDLINELNLKEADFLNLCNNNVSLDKNINIIKFLSGKIADGTIESHGLFFCHTAKTEEGTSGSPLLNNNNEILGVHKGKINLNNNDSNENKEVNVAIKYSIIDYIIRTLYINKDIIKIDISKGTPKELSKDELEELESHGLKIIQKKKKSNKVSSSSKIFMTSKIDSSPILYFYRTNHAWYWTDIINEVKNECDKYKKKNLIKCKWRIIKSINEEEEYDINNYNGIGHRNKVIITFLKLSGLKYITGYKDD